VTLRNIGTSLTITTNTGKIDSQFGTQHRMEPSHKTDIEDSKNHKKVILFSSILTLFGDAMMGNTTFLPRDASAERGNAIVSRPSVCL